jgi:hypothetical protein
MSKKCYFIFVIIAAKKKRMFSKADTHTHTHKYLFKDWEKYGDGGMLTNSFAINVKTVKWR